MSAPVWDGVPLNPERDGAHWIIGRNNSPFVAEWTADTSAEEGGYYEWPDGGDVPSGVTAQGWSYGGPCLTPDQVAAAVQAERAACLAIVQNVYPVTNGATREWRKARDAIRARGDTSALDAAIKAAEARGMERAAAFAAERGAWASNELDSDHMVDRFRAEGRMDMAGEIAAAIRAGIEEAKGGGA